MEYYTTNKRYCPHEIVTKINSVQIYRQTGDISYVCRKYKISKASLMRWNKAYDGTKESLMAKSHRTILLEKIVRIFALGMRMALRLIFDNGRF